MVLTIGIGIFCNIMSTVVIGIILSPGSAVSAIAIVVIVHRKRKEAERKSEEEAAAIRGKR